MTSVRNKRIHKESEDRYISSLKLPEADSSILQEHEWRSMSLEEKLLARPIEDDTKILNTSFIEFDFFTGLLESWYWNNIVGKSVIILKEDSERFSSDEKCSDYLFSQIQMDSVDDVITKELNRYFFVNFNMKHKN